MRTMTVERLMKKLAKLDPKTPIYLGDGAFTNTLNYLVKCMVHKEDGDVMNMQDWKESTADDFENGLADKKKYKHAIMLSNES